MAAGKGKRMNKDYNKQYILLDDKPIVAHTIQVFEDSSYIDEIILVVASGEVELASKSIVNRYGFEKITHVLEGGAERQDSVKIGLNAVDEDSEIILVHDGARPFVEEGIIEESIHIAREFGAAIAAVPVKDTIKIINEAMEVTSTPKRETLWAIQTPQVFKSELLKKAYEKLDNMNPIATDDSMLVERLGHAVKIISGSYENIKITTPEDLLLGIGILKNRAER